MDIPPRARICHLRKWPDFNGYGFNLQAERGRIGEYIGTIEPQSPSEATGLRPGDKIIEVNGVNVTGENHQQVVQRIKAIPNETILLVVDAEADTYFRARNVMVSSDSPDVEHKTTPEVNPYTSGRGSWGAHGREAEEEEQEEEDEEDGDRITELKSFSPPIVYNNETAIVNSHERAMTSGLNNMAIKDPELPRLCRLRRWPDFDGYGFNLHSERGKPGQFIGKVDPQSPAELAGLRQGDRIVEVNGTNMMNELHPAVVIKVKEFPREVTMLVVDVVSEHYYAERGIVISGDMVGVRRIECPPANPFTNPIPAGDESADFTSGGSLDRRVSVDVAEEYAEKERGAHFYDEADAIKSYNMNNNNNNNNYGETEPAMTYDGRPTAALVESPRTSGSMLAPSSGYISGGTSPAPRSPTYPSPPTSSTYPTAAPRNQPTAQSSTFVTSRGETVTMGGGVGGGVSGGGGFKSSPTMSPSNGSGGGRGGSGGGGLEFAASAKEAREKMLTSGKKRNAVKEKNMSAKDKYDLLQKL